MEGGSSDRDLSPSMVMIDKMHLEIHLVCPHLQPAGCYDNSSSRWSVSGRSTLFTMWNMVRKIKVVFLLTDFASVVISKWEPQIAEITLENSNSVTCFFFKLGSEKDEKTLKCFRIKQEEQELFYSAAI